MAILVLFHFIKLKIYTGSGGALILNNTKSLNNLKMF